MKISLNWLNEYVDAKEFFQKPEELSKLLTAAGLEVEGFDDPAKAFRNVVVGHIVELGRHPNADKLTLCQVDVGDGKPRQIVCGAKNHKQGDKVVAALVGAVLPGDFAIKLSKIRDVESQGMLCSESELGLKEKSEGIVILPADAKVGRPFAEYQGLSDIVYEINVTPNRADCLSHVGLAREVSCLLDRKLKLPQVTVKSGSKKCKDHIAVQLNNSEACPRYAGRSIFGVKVGPSPDWLRQRVESVGVNSINNIVDITNFVMLECGQPLHAFDADTLKGKKIIIENAKPQEKFKSFDGTEITLKGDELTIRDGERAVALAGIVGGLNSGVTDQTKDIFLEAAYFNPRIVRRTSRKHGVDTDSSQRFSRGIDAENVVNAMNRAASLIAELGGGEISSDHYDQYPAPITRKPIAVRGKILNDRLGYAVDLKDFSNWMTRLHCGVKAEKEGAQITPPSFRVDLEIEMDLVEEYARLNGYDKIPEAFPPLLSEPTLTDATFRQDNRLADLLKDQGLLEACNYNFLNPNWQNQIYSENVFQKLGLAAGGAPVAVRNPLSEETSVMRQSLLPGLLTNLLHNYHHGVLSGRLFETGFVFAKKDNYLESHRAALVMWGESQGLWAQTKTPVIYEIKSILESVAQSLKSQIDFRALPPEAVPTFIHAGQCALLFYEGKNIGFVGALHPAFRDEHKIRHEAAVCEIDLTALMRGQPRLKKLSRISKFPAVERDFALVLPLTLPVGDVLKEIKKSAGQYLTSAAVFDVYKGSGVAEGHQSVAFRLTLSDTEATLSEERVTQITDQVLMAVEKKFGVKKRG